MFSWFSRGSQSFLRRLFNPNISALVGLFCPSMLSFLSGLYKAIDRSFQPPLLTLLLAAAISLMDAGAQYETKRDEEMLCTNLTCFFPNASPMFVNL